MGPVTVTSATSLTADITIGPSATSGARTVTITTGTEVASLSDGFTVFQSAPTPIISLVNPNAGSQGQVSSVAITGRFTSFVQGKTLVSFGVGITLSGVTVTTPTNLTAAFSIAADVAPGARTVTATTGAEVASLANGFTVTNGTPAITLVNRNSGQQGQQALTVTITGQLTNFVQGKTQVGFGAGITVNTAIVTNPTSLTANLSVTADATVGTRTVTVTTGTEVVSLANGFTVAAGTPVITLVNPNSGQQAQTLNVAITAQFTGFVQDTTTVSFGDGITVNTVVVGSATTLTAGVSIAANATAGPRTVIVTTGSEVVSLPSGFIVAVVGAPQISDFNPKTGPVGTLIAVTGRTLSLRQAVRK